MPRDLLRARTHIKTLEPRCQPIGGHDEGTRQRRLWALLRRSCRPIAGTKAPPHVDDRKALPASFRVSCIPGRCCRRVVRCGMTGAWLRDWQKDEVWARGTGCCSTAGPGERDRLEPLLARQRVRAGERGASSPAQPTDRPSRAARPRSGRGRGIPPLFCLTPGEVHESKCWSRCRRRAPIRHAPAALASVHQMHDEKAFDFRVAAGLPKRASSASLGRDRERRALGGTGGMERIRRFARLRRIAVFYEPGDIPRRSTTSRRSVCLGCPVGRVSS